jgi:hypothetical protein
MAGTENNARPFRKELQPRIRSEYFTLFSECNLVFSNLHIRRRPAFILTFFSFLRGVFTGHGFSYLYQDRRRVIHSSYFVFFVFYACYGASGGFICFFRVAELLYSTYDSLIPFFHEYIIEFTSIQPRVLIISRVATDVYSCPVLFLLTPLSAARADSRPT